MFQLLRLPLLQLRQLPSLLLLPLLLVFQLLRLPLLQLRQLPPLLLLPLLLLFQQLLQLLPLPLTLRIRTVLCAKEGTARHTPDGRPAPYTRDLRPHPLLHPRPPLPAATARRRPHPNGPLLGGHRLKQSSVALPADAALALSQRPRVAGRAVVVAPRSLEGRAVEQTVS